MLPGLENMCTLASSEFVHKAVRTHIDIIINTLKMERDIRVLQQAADLYPCATGATPSRSCRDGAVPSKSLLHHL